jgi:dimethylamine/trimethylamine dehydrogenase
MTTTAPETQIEGYLEMLQRFYEEEIEGAAYFDALAERFSHAEQRRKMHLMAQVERYAAAAVAPLLAKYHLIARDAAVLQASGHKQAQNVMADWPALISEMRRTFPDYMPEFRAIEDLAPPQDLPQLKMLTAHEIAAIAFLEAEAKGDPDSDAPLINYLRTGTA